jgi:hypothetical protein
VVQFYIETLINENRFEELEKFLWEDWILKNDDIFWEGFFIGLETLFNLQNSELANDKIEQLQNIYILEIRKWDNKLLFKRLWGFQKFQKNILYWDNLYVEIFFDQILKYNNNILDCNSDLVETISSLGIIRSTDKSIQESVKYIKNWDFEKTRGILYNLPVGEFNVWENKWIDNIIENYLLENKYLELSQVLWRLLELWHDIDDIILKYIIYFKKKWEHENATYLCEYLIEFSQNNYIDFIQDYLVYLRVNNNISWLLAIYTCLSNNWIIDFNHDIWDFFIELSRNEKFDYAAYFYWEFINSNTEVEPEKATEYFLDTLLKKNKYELFLDVLKESLKLWVLHEIGKYSEIVNKLIISWYYHYCVEIYTYELSNWNNISYSDCDFLDIIINNVKKDFYPYLWEVFNCYKNIWKSEVIEKYLELWLKKCFDVEDYNQLTYIICDFIAFFHSEEQVKLYLKYATSLLDSWNKNFAAKIYAACFSITSDKNHEKNIYNIALDLFQTWEVWLAVELCWILMNINTEKYCEFSIKVIIEWIKKDYGCEYAQIYEPLIEWWDKLWIIKALELVDWLLLLWDKCYFWEVLSIFKKLQASNIKVDTKLDEKE